MNDIMSFDLDRILHQPIRTKIVSYLVVHQSCDFNTIKKLFHLSDGHMTTHMRELLDSGYVIVEKQIIEGKLKTVYHITDVGKQAFSNYVTMLKQILLLS